jgi:dUTP pyrophosphatase
MPGGLLDKASLLKLMKATPPLVEGALDLDVQVQPNGIDLTLRDVSSYGSGGRVDFTNAQRALPATSPIPMQGDELSLATGAYLVTFNEVVHIPRDIAALGRTRSTLLRCGAALHTAVWDAGYSGRSQSLLTVYNPHGIALTKNARILQLLFFRLEHAVVEGYTGRYQGETGSS